MSAVAHAAPGRTGARAGTGTSASATGRACWLVVLWAPALVTILGAAVTPRFYETNARGQTSSVDGLLPEGLAGPANKAVLGCLLAVVVVALWDIRLSRRTGWLGAAALALGAGPLISGIATGNVPPDRAQFALPFVAVGLIAVGAPSLSFVARHASRLLLLFVYGSLVAAVTLPHWALQEHYAQGLLPIPRLHGLAPHANVLGAIAATYLVLAWVWPPPQRALRTVHVIAALSVLVLTQCKTAMLGYVLLLLIRHLAAQDLRGSVRRLLAAGLVTTTAATSLVVLAVSPDSIDAASHSTVGAAAQTTYSSRYAIWAATYGTWREAPVLGYGPALWGQDMRASYAPALGFEAPTAHNQVLQSLGEAGIVGLAGLAVYLAALAGAAAQTARATRFASVGLVGLLLIRCIDETPLRTALSDGSLLLNVVMLAVLIAAMQGAGGAGRIGNEIARGR